VPPLPRKEGEVMREFKGGVMTTLQELYDSEINFSISTFWDAGFEWQLGDELNGYRASGQTRTFAGAVAELIDAALEHYPNSVFAK